MHTTKGEQLIAPQEQFHSRTYDLPQKILASKLYILYQIKSLIMKLRMFAAGIVFLVLVAGISYGANAKPHRGQRHNICRPHVAVRVYTPPVRVYVRPARLYGTHMRTRPHCGNRYYAHRYNGRTRHYGHHYYY